MQLNIPRDIEQQCAGQISAVFDTIPEVRGIEAGTRIAVDQNGQTLDEFVRLIASGCQNETPKTTSWNITVEGWAQSETRAARITSLALAALENAHGELFGYRLLGGAGNDPEPDYPHMSRYSATVEMRSRNIITDNH
ncbi:hypothetical protein [Bifidobacterium sp. ESL0790]|uniref:hypothetical protein n=1 Tax=Bifidobacterium sp. ESL0790 TaxID=2983233 RepID=UPI0023F7F6B4|nr:hypothetical protein [Bifidobacterium sp. ESL0790]WEV72150.1 hypothetical protein OZY47_06835 [Bifidobacterium sp. ESL0790]